MPFGVLVAPQTVSFFASLSIISNSFAFSVSDSSCLNLRVIVWSDIPKNSATSQSLTPAFFAYCLNFERAIHISKSLYKIKGEPIQTKDTKTHESRKVAIPEYCIKLLKRWQAQQAETRLKLGTAWKGANWVFIQSDGSIIYPTSPTLMFSDFLKRNGLPHKKFHALRHTSATLLLVSGANIKNVSARLGHAQITTTNRYVHAIEEADRVAGDTLGNIVSDLQLKKA